MRIIRNILLVLLGLLLIGTLHYTLPGRDVVKIVGTDVKRMDVGRYALFWANADAGTQQVSTRDVRFINTEKPGGGVRVYRNEDTDWSWPPYFKFDSGNVTAEAQALAQRGDVWVAVKHYGVRIKLFSIFPNIVSIKEVAGPDVVLIPWFRIIFVILLIALLLFIRARIVRFRERRIDPVTESIQSNINETLDAARDTVDEGQKRTSGFLKRWFGTTKQR
ncbi:MAG: DUF1523 family protein [Pseudomonadota bacterium]